MHVKQEHSYTHTHTHTLTGWEWVNLRQASHPIFWVCNEGCKTGCGGDLATYSHCTPIGHEDRANGLNVESRTKYRLVCVYM